MFTTRVDYISHSLWVLSLSSVCLLLTPSSHSALGHYSLLRNQDNLIFLVGFFNDTIQLLKKSVDNFRGQHTSCSTACSCWKSWVLFTAVMRSVTSDAENSKSALDRVLPFVVIFERFWETSLSSMMSTWPGAVETECWKAKERWTKKGTSMNTCTCAQEIPRPVWWDGKWTHYVLARFTNNCKHLYVYL